MNWSKPSKKSKDNESSLEDLSFLIIDSKILEILK